MDFSSFKQRLLGVDNPDQLEIEEIFVAANRSNRASPNNDSSSKATAPKDGEDNFGDLKSKRMSHDDPNLTGERAQKFKTPVKSRRQLVKDIENIFKDIGSEVHKKVEMTGYESKLAEKLMEIREARQEGRVFVKDGENDSKKSGTTNNETNITGELSQKWSREKEYENEKQGLTKDELNLTEQLLEKWKASGKFGNEEKMLARDIENVLKNQEKMNAEDKFTLEVEFRRGDVPFNILVEPAKELNGSSNGGPEARDVSNSDKLNLDVEKNSILLENPLSVDIEVLPIVKDKNFSTELDNSQFREQCISRILKEDHKPKPPAHVDSLPKSSSKNQTRAPIFMRDLSTKSVNDFEDEPTRDSAFERDFSRTKPNDVLHSWVQLMEGYLEEAKAKWTRKMYGIEEEGWDLEDGDEKNNHYDGPRVKQEAEINEAFRMISRAKLYPAGSSTKVTKQMSNTPSAADKKQGVIKSPKKNKDVAPAQKKQVTKGKRKDAKKGKKKYVDKAGPEIYKPQGPVFKPPPLKNQRIRKSFIIDVERPILRSSPGFGVLGKIPIN